MNSTLEEKQFCTGSSYKGTYNEYGMMDGFGVYKFPDGTIYQGNFKNGMFHGKGTITLPSFFKFHGDFVEGKCDKYEMEFSDGAPYLEEDWSYCKYPDRRYYSSIEDGIPPFGECNLTAHDPPRKIPEGWYDTEEGFFDPVLGYIMSSDDPTEIIRNVSPQERKWIINHCRNTNKSTVGYQQDIIDENVLALQELFEADTSECICFTTSTSDLNTLSTKDSYSLFSGSRGSPSLEEEVDEILIATADITNTEHKLHPEEVRISSPSQPSVPSLKFDSSPLSDNFEIESDIK